jgi:hypothetical protein
MMTWAMSEGYPDPSVEVLDPSFQRYRLFHASVEKLAGGCRWAEGPVWFGDGRFLLWSDLPNNRILRWDESSGTVSTFRQPSNYANGNTRDRQGRLITCEHDARRITRTEYDGGITVLCDSYQGKRLNRSAVRHPRLLRRPQGHAGAAAQRLSAGSPHRRAEPCSRRYPGPEWACLLAGRARPLHCRIARRAARDSRL